MTTKNKVGYKCPVCGDEFKSPKAKGPHQKKHTNHAEFDPEAMGARVVARRRKLGFVSTGDFAEYLGIGHAQLWAWETGQYKNLTIQSILFLAEHLGLSLDWLVRGGK